MGGFFGAVSKHDAISDVFFGTDYHSHLGTKRGGIAAFDKEIGLQREIHNIENSPFRKPSPPSAPPPAAPHLLIFCPPCG